MMELIIGFVISVIILVVFALRTPKDSNPSDDSCCGGGGSVPQDDDIKDIKNHENIV